MNAANTYAASRPQRHVPSINVPRCTSASRLHLLLLMPPPRWNPRAYPDIPYISRKLESLAYILPLMISVYLRSNFSGQHVRQFDFYKRGVSAVQGHPRSLTMVAVVPIESAYATSYQSVIVTLILSCTVSEIRHVLCAPDPTLFHPSFAGVSVALDCPCWGQQARRP